MSNTIFAITMNQAKYDSLPPDLKKVIDANSGLDWSKQIGKVFDGTTEPAKKLAVAAGGVFDTLSQAEYDRWVKATEGVNKEWITEINAKGANGEALLNDARALIRNHGGRRWFGLWMQAAAVPARPFHRCARRRRVRGRCCEAASRPARRLASRRSGA